MKEIAIYIFNYFWMFGALLFWPSFKFLLKIPSEKINTLKWLFWLQVFWLVASYATIQYYRIAGYKDWLHSLILPYAVGLISWIAVIIALFFIGFKNKKKSINE